MGIPRPTLPVMFYKSNQTITHPNAPVLVSKVAQREELDYEVELAIVIGRDCKDATVENALSFVSGYTCANDITARKHQAESSQWSFSKSVSRWFLPYVSLTVAGFDNFCPVGPCVVSTRAMINPHKLRLQTTVDGRVLQDGTSSTMVFTIAE
jgi:2-keto-4-pentenoate hydratase/2-oxohepta-3-ene-1,7-dioic acid hydratase in catechol pathway